MEENKKELEIVEDELLPKELDTLPLEESTNKLVTDIIKTDNVEELKTLTNLFSLNQAKKNALRVVKLNGLLDAIHDQAIERFIKHPHEISNKELLDYMNVVANQIEKSQQSLGEIDNKPMIQINNQTNKVEVNVGDGLSRDSKENVVDAINKLMTLFKSPPAEDVPTLVDTSNTIVINKETEDNGQQ